MPVAGATVRLGGATATTGADGARDAGRARGPAPAHREQGRARPRLPADGDGRLMRRALLAPARPRSHVAAGCGLGAGDSQDGGATVTVTRDFGARELGDGQRRPDPRRRDGDADAAARLRRRDALRRRLRAGDQRDRRRARERPARRLVLLRQRHPGRRRRRRAQGRAPATGSGGTTTTGARRRTSARSSARSRSRSCPASTASGCRCGSTAPTTPRTSATRSPSGSRDAGVKVGPLRAWRASAARACCASRSGRGPSCAATPRCAGSRRARARRASSRGPRRTAARSRCSTPRARPCGTLGPGGGLVAATRLGGEAPTWIVTGTDAAGVAAAAAQLAGGRARATTSRSPSRTAGRSALPLQTPAENAVTYLRRASPLHAARAARSASALVRRAGRRRALVRAPARARSRCWPRSSPRPPPRGSAGRVLLALALALPFALAHRARQPARRPRRADGDRAAGRRCPCSASSTSPPRRPPTAACSALRALVVVGCFALHSAAVDPDELLRAFRRVSLPLRADRGARDAAGPGARARRAPAARRAALPRGGARAAARGRARGRRGRARPRGRRRRHARGARLRRRPARAARRRPAVVAPRPRVRARARSRSRPSRSPRTSRGVQDFSALPAFSAPVGAGAARRSCAVARRLRAAAVRRPPGDRPMSAAAARARHLPLPGRAARPRCATSTCDVAPGEFVVLAGASGSGKSTLLRAACGLVPHFHGGEFGGRLEVGGLDTRDARARPRSPRSRARCSRTPRRRS